MHVQNLWFPSLKRALGVPKLPISGWYKNTTISRLNRESFRNERAIEKRNKIELQKIPYISQNLVNFYLAHKRLTLRFSFLAALCAIFA